MAHSTSTIRVKRGALQPSRAPGYAQRYFRRYWPLYVMMALPIVYFIIFKYGPMFGNILAFRRYRLGLSPFGTDWVGLYYFERFLKDASFWRAFRNTLVLSGLNLAINFPIPILFAVLLNETRFMRFKKVVQSVSYMPRFVSTVVVISMLTEILSPSSGIVNKLMKSAGMEPVFFMNKPEYFRGIYVLTEMWQYTGWTAIIYLAAITAINGDLYEAAMIDGAGRFQQMIYVTLPCILPTIMVMLILNVGHLLNLGFEKVLLMYTSTNAPVADIIDTYVYRYGLQKYNYSYAAAVGFFGSIIGVALVTGANFTSRRLTGESIY